jgi:hypothetical protein
MVDCADLWNGCTTCCEAEACMGGHPCLAPTIPRVPQHRQNLSADNCWTRSSSRQSPARRRLRVVAFTAVEIDDGATRIVTGPDRCSRLVSRGRSRASEKHTRLLVNRGRCGVASVIASTGCGLASLSSPAIATTVPSRPQAKCGR